MLGGITPNKIQNTGGITPNRQVTKPDQVGMSKVHWDDKISELINT